MSNPATSSPARSRIAPTPMVSRPIGRTSFSENRAPLPWRVTTSSSSPPVEILTVELHVPVADLGATGVGEALAQLGQLVLDQLIHQPGVGEDVLEAGDLLDESLVLLLDPARLQPGQAAQAEIDDRLRLPLTQLEALLQGGLRRLLVLGRPDQRDHLVDVVEALEQPLQDVSPLPRPSQEEAGAPDHDLASEVDEGLEDRLEPQDLRPAVNQRQHQGTEGVLELGVFEQVVEHGVRTRARLQLDDDPGALGAPRLIAQVGDPLDLLLVDQLCDAREQARLVDLVGELADDDLLAAV